MLLVLPLLLILLSYYSTCHCWAHQHDEEHHHHHTSTRHLSGIGDTGNAFPKHDCGVIHHDLTTEERQAQDKSERQMFGKRVSDMVPEDLSSIVQTLVTVNKAERMFQSQSNSETLPSFTRNEFMSSNSFQLINVPLVYHVLPNQDNGAKGKPTMTASQREYTTNRTNELFNVYDKKTRSAVQFVNFVTNATIVHKRFRKKKDCGDITDEEFQLMVQSVPEWEYKFHAVICESSYFSGRASFPGSYLATYHMHNLFVVDYRALGCYDHRSGKYLCEKSDPVTGEPVSHTRWWRTRSTVLAHEIGHLFGLFHTFGGCEYDDEVPDTPFLDTPETIAMGCPGLLPYNKDRDLFDPLLRRKNNKGGNATTCGSKDRVCSGSTCAACCKPDNNSSTVCLQRTASDPTHGDVTEDDKKSSPVCCVNQLGTRLRQPVDTCPEKRGIDPLNNVMSYVPDFCVYEFTPGQLARMMAQIRSYKTYIYCNYANIIDKKVCTSKIPCSSLATNPRCL